MSTITVRGLEPEVTQRLKERAAANHRSMEAEARAILREAVRADTFVADWLRIAEEYRRATNEGDPEFELPERSMPREIDFS